MRRFWVLLLLLFCIASFAQQLPLPSKSISDSIKLVWGNVAHDFTALAEVMPEDKWSFKPTQGTFDNVRTFGEQVKHVACGNEAWAKKIKGEKKLPERCDLGGDDAELLLAVFPVTTTCLGLKKDPALRGRGVADNGTHIDHAQNCGSISVDTQA